MFIKNKYYHWYYSIIENAAGRQIVGYTEKHHIIPRSFGGSDDSDNIVRLTAREHFICHLLLCKMTSGKYNVKMNFAIYLMRTPNSKRSEIYNQLTSKQYETIKINFSKSVSVLKKGCIQPPRTSIAKENYSKSKLGRLNPKYKYSWKTPWGIFDSSRNAAKSCPEYITDISILNYCQRKNEIPISYLSVCRSKGYLKDEYVGMTPKELGFGIVK